MKIAQVMTTNPASCRSEESMAVAARVMWERDVGSVPVIDDRQRVIGMVTDRDICMAALMNGRPLWEIPIAAAMARDVVCCTAREDVASVERRMGARQIRRIPVIDDDGRLVGIVSIADLARACACDQVIAAGAIAALLADVGERRTPDTFQPGQGFQGRRTSTSGGVAGPPSTGAGMR